MEETAQNVDPKTAVQKLKQQNDKLKSELSQLRSALQTAVNNQKQASIQSKRPNFSAESEDRELQVLHQKIKKLKNERNSLKVQILANSDSNTTQLENELKYLRTQVKDAENEQSTLLKVQKDQENHMENLSTGQSVADRIAKLKEEIKDTKDEYRELQEVMKTEEAKWLDDHKKMLALESRIREANGKSNKPPKNSEAKNQEEDELTELKRRADVLNKAINTEEAKGKRYISEAETGLRNLQDEDLNTKKKLKEKDQECQLKILKIKELKRTISTLQNKNREEEPSRDERQREPEYRSDSPTFESGGYKESTDFDMYGEQSNSPGSKHKKNESRDYEESGKEYYSKPKLDF